MSAEYTRMHARNIEMIDDPHRRRPRIMHVGNFLSGSGLNASVTEELADRLEMAGWETMRTSSVALRPLRLLDMLSSVWRERKRIDGALIAVFSGSAFRWAEAVSAALRWLDKPSALTLHGGNLPDMARRHPERIRRLLDSASIVTSPSAFLAEAMQPFRSDIRVIPNPLDTSVFRGRTRTRAASRLVWVRAFHQIYNPQMMPRVIAALKHDHPDIQAVMVGPDKGDGSRQETEALASQLGVLDRMSFPGGVPAGDVPRWLDRGDIFLNTTRVDNTPVSVLQALAGGLAVVSTSVGGIPYLLTDRETALLVPSDNPTAMASAVHELLSDSSAFAALSERGRAYAARFDWSVVLPQWEQLLHELARS